MTTKHLLTLLLAVYGLVCIGGVEAADLEVATQPAEIPGLPAAAGETLKLDLAGAYELALSRNLDLQVGRYGLAAAGSGILSGSGVFDPAASLGVDQSYSKSPTTNELQGADVAEDRRSNFNLGLSQLLPTGTGVKIETGFHRSDTSNSFFNLNPAWQGDLGISITQPLLNGFGTFVNRSGIVIAANSRDQVAVGFTMTVIDTLSQVEGAYWDLVAARAAIAVSERSLALAQQLLDETRERVKVGTSAPIDLVQSEATVAARRQDVISARNGAGNAEDLLKAVLGFDRPEEWTVTIETTEDYAFEPLHPDLSAAINTGLEQRPELAQKELGLQNLAINTRLARNDVLPSVGVSASYGYGGIGGTRIIRDPDTGEVLDTIDGGINDAWTQITDRSFPSWTLGLSVSMPFGNHEAKGTLAQRRYEFEKGRTELAALEQEIIRQVRTAVRGLEDGAAAVDAAVAAREFAERNLEAEQTKFENGLSTNYQVLQIQEDLAEAQLSEIRARLSYRKALVGYRVAIGALLEKSNVEILDPEDTKIPHDYWKNVKWLQFVDFKGSGGDEEAAK